MEVKVSTVEKKWLNTEELSAYAGLSVSTIHTYISREILPFPHYKHGHILRYKISEVDAWLETGKIETKKGKRRAPEKELIQEN